MAVETNAMQRSHDLYNTRDLGGNYADLGRAMGGYAERVTDPNDISGAFQRARRQNEEGNAVLLEFITNAEINYSHRRAF
jgi:acetolactate synthase-1/2/3 large subunit